MALIRTHYILGEIKEADALIEKAGGSALFFNSVYQEKLKHTPFKPLKEAEKKQKADQSQPSDVLGEPVLPKKNEPVLPKNSELKK